MAAGRVRTALVAVLALVLVAALLVVGTMAWKRLHRTPLQEALALVPASSLRVSFTDWSVVRRELGSRVDDAPSSRQVTRLMGRAYDKDYSAASSINDSAAGMQEKLGFSPATAQWEAFAQGRQGATMVLKVADGADFDILADNLATAGYGKPKRSDGVWRGGADLVANLDPTFTPELQYAVLLEDRGLVVTSDSATYAARAAKVASGDADSFASVAGVSDLATHVAGPANAILWGKDFACRDLAMSQADEDDQARAETLVQRAGGVTPIAGLSMAMLPDRTLRVTEHFEDSARARKNLEPRAKLAVGDAPGRGVSFADSFTLTSSKAIGSDVVLDLRPKAVDGFVLSALYDGPVLFATC